MNNKILPYLLIFILSVVIIFAALQSNFNLKTTGIILFLLIFIPTIINPFIGFVIIIVSMLYSPEIIIGQTTARYISIRIEDVLLAVVVFAWFIRTALTKNMADTFKTRLNAPFGLYILTGVVSTILAALSNSETKIDLTQSFFTLLKYVEYYMLFCMVKDSVKSVKQVRILTTFFILTALLVSVYANAYINEQKEENAQFFRAEPPTFDARRGGESGTLGGYLLFMMAIAGGLALYTNSNSIRLLLVFFELFLFRALLYTLSRGTYLAFLPMVGALFFFTKKFALRMIGFYGIPIFLFIMVMFTPQMIKDRVMSTIVINQNAEEGISVNFEDSPEARLSSWNFVLFQKFPESPIFGHGVAKYFIDSQFFLTLTEMGLAGLALLLWIIIRLFKMALSVIKNEVVKNDTFAMGLSVGFLAGFVGLIVHAISANTFIIIKVMEPFWFIAAMVLSLPQLVKSEEDTALERA